MKSPFSRHKCLVRAWGCLWVRKHVEARAPLRPWAEWLFRVQGMCRLHLKSRFLDGPWTCLLRGPVLWVGGSYHKLSVRGSQTSRDFIQSSPGLHPPLNIHLSSSSPKPFLQLPRDPQKCLPLPREWGTQRGHRTPFSGSGPWLLTAVSRGWGLGRAAFLSHTFPPGNPRQSRSGTSSRLPRPVGPRTGPTCVVGRELTSCLPWGTGMFLLLPNISGFSLVLNLSRKNLSCPR